MSFSFSILNSRRLSLEMETVMLKQSFNDISSMPALDAVAGLSSSRDATPLSPTPPPPNMDKSDPVTEAVASLTAEDGIDKAEAAPIEQKNADESILEPKQDEMRQDSPAPAPEKVEIEAPSEADIEAMAAKKRKLAVVADESKKRSKRMFGLLQNTLKQAKEDTSVMSGAAKKRHELEERLALKLSSEKKESAEKHEREKATKELKLNVVKKEEEINIVQSIYTTRHAAKLKLAEFLCTTFTLPPPPAAADGISASFAPRLPHSLRLTNPRMERPIYYRPKRLLYFQEDQIEDQVAAVKKALRREKEDWEDAKGTKIDGLEFARRKRDEGLEEIERKDRENRQRKRREKEEQEEKVAEARNQARELSPATKTAGDGDEQSTKMDIDSTASQKGINEETSAPPTLDPAVQGMNEARPPIDDATMTAPNVDQDEVKGDAFTVKSSADSAVEGEAKVAEDEDLEY